MTTQVTLDAEIVKLLSPACKAEIAAHLGFDSAPQLNDPDVDEDAEEFAELGVQAARAFLQGCGDKTTNVLQRIVDAGENFSLRKLEAQMNVEEGALRGVWTGLTKRVRTITGDPEIALIDWGKETENGDYRGRLMPVSREAFRRALAE